MDMRLAHDLRALRPEAKEAGFKNLETGEDVVMPYEMIHVTPPMSAADFVRASGLTNADGWVKVDEHTLRHVRFPNVFSLGDNSSLPTSKTGAAIRMYALKAYALPQMYWHGMLRGRI